MINKRSVIFIPLFLGIFLLVNSGFASAQIYKDVGDGGTPEDGPDYEEQIPNGSGGSSGPVQAGSLTFSPGTVSNGQTFSISVSGAPANATTRIWVNNGDSLGFRNFGDWERTNSSGSIFVNRTLNCSSYQTLNPGQTLPIGNKILTQQVYLEYVGTGKISPVTSHSKNCLTSGGSSGSPSDTPDDSSGPSSDVPDRTDPTNKYSFPGSSTYTLNTSKGPLTAALKFAPPIKKITFGQRNLSTYLGNNFQNIAWVANRYGGGPAGRWNISDPWNPKEPEVVGISYGPATDLGRGQPAEHRGPFNNKNYPHTTMFSSGTFADAKNGEARFAFETGIGLEYSGRALKIILEYGSGFGASLGQLLDFDWYNIFGQTKMQAGEKDGDDTSVAVIDATADGKFFLFGPGTREANRSGDSVIVYDITNLSGDPRDEKNSIGKILWSGVNHLEIIEVPGVRNHFLLARSGSATDPRIYVAEIDSLSGTVVRQQNVDLELNPKMPNRNGFPYAGDNFRDVSVNGKTYVFTIESFDNNGSVYTDTPGTLKIAAFEFNPSDLSFARKGDISLNRFPAWQYIDRRDVWNIVKTVDGSAYPLLAAFKIDESSVTTKPDSYTGRSTFIDKIDLAHYSLKDLLSASSTTSIVNPDPDFVIESQKAPVPMPFGGVLTTPFTVMGGNYHSFLKKEGETVNMYLYRQSLLWTGRQGGDNMMPYDDIYPAAVGEDQYIDKETGMLHAAFSGVATLRVDKIDVSGFTGGAMPVNPNDPTVPPGPNNPFPSLPTPDPAIFTKSCEELYPNSPAMVSLCNQINFVQERSCQIVPGLPFCKENLNAQY